MNNFRGKSLVCLFWSVGEYDTGYKAFVEGKMAVNKKEDSISPTSFPKCIH